MKPHTVSVASRYNRSSRVWFAIPVAQACVKEAQLTFEEWNALGYNCIALVDGPCHPYNCVCREVTTYMGWAWATNLLAEFLGSQFDWLVAGGHDVFPHPDLKAVEIAAQCLDHFKGTYGVMQPCGDAYGALADRSACVSAWIGRDFCEKHGPFHEGYFHFWADTELKHVATKAVTSNGASGLWWRDDLAQYHDHHLRRPGARPEHLKEANARAKDDEALFLRRKAMAFA